MRYGIESLSRNRYMKEDECSKYGATVRICGFIKIINTGCQIAVLNKTECREVSEIPNYMNLTGWMEGNSNAD